MIFDATKNLPWVESVSKVFNNLRAQQSSGLGSENMDPGRIYTDKQELGVPEMFHV